MSAAGEAEALASGIGGAARGGHARATDAGGAGDVAAGRGREQRGALLGGGGAGDAGAEGTVAAGGGGGDGRAVPVEGTTKAMKSRARGARKVMGKKDGEPHP